jgi:hypothetical protein
LLSPKCKQQDVRIQLPSSSSLNGGVVECQREGIRLVVMVIIINNTNNINGMAYLRSSCCEETSILTIIQCSVVECRKERKK